MAKRKKKKNQLQIAVIALIVAIVFLIVGIAVSLLLWARDPARHRDPIQLPSGTPAASNEYDAEAFYLEDGFLRYEQPHLVGIDVSAYQGIIDWQQVADSGVEFAIIRGGYRGSSQGLLYKDETFYDNLKGAKNAGIKVGVYFFSQARDIDEAIEEAEFITELLAGEELDLPVFYDWELVEGSERIPNLDGVPMTDCAAAFCERVKQEGHQAGVYFNQAFGYHHLDMGRLQDYTLWLAEYNPYPTFEYYFDLVQYSDKGQVPGISTAVDLNLWISK